MRHSRGPEFSVSRLKIHVFGHKLDTLCATRADPNLAFCALQSVFKVKNLTLYAPPARTRFFHFTPLNPYFWSKIRHFFRHSRGPDFSVSRLKIHVFGQKLDTFSATRADTIFPFHALKSMFLVKN